MEDTKTESNTGGEVQPAIVVPKPSVAERRLAERQREIQLDKASQVATKSSSMFDPIAYAQLKALATDLINGGAATKDADTPEKLMVKLQAGYEMGMQPTEASNSLYIVNGRITIWGAALIGRLRRAGWQVSYGEESPESCTIYVRRGPDGDEQMITDTFKYQDAVDSGYTADAGGKPKIGWKKGQNRKLKMRYGAAAQLVKTYLPEVLNGNVGVAEIDQDAPLIIENESETAEDRKARVTAAVEAHKASHGPMVEAEFVPKAVTGDAA